MSGMAATGAALRLRLLFRMLRVGELLALLALLSWSSSRAPSAAAAAAARVAGSLLFSPRFVFVLGNAIVLLLLALSRRERESSPVSSATNYRPAAALTPEVPAVGSFSSSAGATTPSPTPTPECDAPVAVVATSAAEVLPCREMATVFEEEVKPAAAAAAARAALSKARAPRRSRSEKMSSRGVSGSRRAASPEYQLMMPVMRRSESENGRRRRSSASARDVAAWAPGTEDAEEFRRTVEAFIAR